MSLLGARQRAPVVHCVHCTVHVMHSSNVHGHCALKCTVLSWRIYCAFKCTIYLKCIECLQHKWHGKSSPNPLDLCFTHNEQQVHNIVHRNGQGSVHSPNFCGGVANKNKSGDAENTYLEKYITAQSEMILHGRKSSFSHFRRRKLVEIPQTVPNVNAKNRTTG